MDSHPQSDPLDNIIPFRSRSKKTEIPHDRIEHPPLDVELNECYQLLLTTTAKEKNVNRVLELSLIDFEQITEEKGDQELEDNPLLVQIIFLKNILRFTSMQEIHESIMNPDTADSGVAVFFKKYFTETQVGLTGFNLQSIMGSNQTVQYLSTEYKDENRKHPTRMAIDSTLIQIVELLGVMVKHGIYFLDENYWEELSEKYKEELLDIDNKA